MILYYTAHLGGAGIDTCFLSPRPLPATMSAPDSLDLEYADFPNFSNVHHGVFVQVLRSCAGKPTGYLAESSMCHGAD